MGQLPEQLAEQPRGDALAPPGLGVADHVVRHLLDERAQVAARHGLHREVHVLVRLEAPQVAHDVRARRHGDRDLDLAVHVGERELLVREARFPDLLHRDGLLRPRVARGDHRAERASAELRRGKRELLVHFGLARKLDA